jgi:PTEN induced putative kinase 1
MISMTLSKTKVLLRVLLSRTSGHYANSWQSVSSDLKTRIISQTTDSPLKQTSSLNKLVNRLLNGHKVLINRYVLKSIEGKVNAKAIIGSSGLSLGFVGVCVAHNGPTLMTETDEMETNCQEIRNIFHSYRQSEFESNVLQTQDLSLDNIEFGECIAKGCNGVVYSAKLKSGYDFTKDWLAIKMLFNFEAESNATDVWNALNKECIPFTGDFMPNADNPMTRRHKLVPHPNIVHILGVFVDRTPQLEGALHLYPDALPIRMGGYARNMTLFIVEKRYDMSLKQYLSAREVPSQTSLVMLTQLLEGISFLTKCQITHRDLKTDNILLTFGNDSDTPWLVITDFGFSLTSLSLPFPCDEVCRGGNRALMAPEIIGAQSGPFARLDYSSSDLWAVGAIAYELFNGLNPFYPYPERQQCLQSISYKESELPEPPKDMPPLIRALVLSFLSRNPNKVYFF